jgi:hypothetical protein
LDVVFIVRSDLFTATNIKTVETGQRLTKGTQPRLVGAIHKIRNQRTEIRDQCKPGQ